MSGALPSAPCMVACMRSTKSTKVLHLLVFGSCTYIAGDVHCMSAVCRTMIYNWRHNGSNTVLSKSLCTSLQQPLNWRHGAVNTLGIQEKAMKVCSRQVKPPLNKTKKAAGSRVPIMPATSRSLASAQC